MKRLGILLLLTILTGCSTHMSRIEYQGAGNPALAGHKQISHVEVIDDRGTDKDWLGAIRGGYGNRLKTLRTDKPTEQVVKDVYIQALTESKFYTSSNKGGYRLRVVLSKFDCSYYFNREAHAHFTVSVFENGTNKEIFTKPYRVDEVEGGVGAGIFGDVDTLRQLAERTLNKAVDSHLQDPNFVDALNTKVHDNTEARLLELKRLLDKGVLQQEEYDAKRAAIVDEI